MSNKIWVYIDQFQGKAVPTSWEVLGAGQMLADQLGGKVTALIFSHDTGEIVKSAFGYGADQVLVADDASLVDYRAEAYTALLVKLAQEHTPEVILFPTTTRGRELAAMSAVDLQTGVIPDVTELEVEAGKIIATRPIYAGKLLAKVQCDTLPQIITCRVRAFPKPEYDSGATGETVNIAPALAEADIPTRVVEYVEAAGGISLNDAGVIVSGGRGTANNTKMTPPAEISDEKEQEIWKAQQGFKLIGDLADVLGGAVGASRAAVDAGYIPYRHQVGQTGKVVSPDLYIAAGISGAIQHLAGMRTSKVIVAINKDPDAPIFKTARFGVIGDLYDVLPPLTKALREKLGK